ncbi:MAG: hypothetical protein RMN25_06720 [Anaerolineae bacterium]|nr:hypothetical protein [Thermoflexales bacterium]MDW8407463.1 hypothetical protein [Anaerolineae bacterium]
MHNDIGVISLTQIVSLKVGFEQSTQQGSGFYRAAFSSSSWNVVPSAAQRSLSSGAVIGVDARLRGREALGLPSLPRDTVDVRSFSYCPVLWAVKSFNVSSG